jgi:CheY-like chemotaxis protein
MEKKKILLVDDEQGFVEIVKPYLESRKYNVIVANNGKEALEKVEENPDLILLDIIMPGIDGFEVLRRLRNNLRTRYIPVIMLTARGESKAILKAQDLGTTDYIIKPFSLKELLYLVKRYILDEV